MPLLGRKSAKLTGAAVVPAGEEANGDERKNSVEIPGSAALKNAFGKASQTLQSMRLSKDQRGDSQGGEQAFVQQWKPPEEADAEKEELTAREKWTKWLNSAPVQTVITFLTIFALFGDDVRLLSFYKADDPAFYVLYIFTFLVFVSELTLNCVIVEDYKWKFFFWLDMIAALSLMPDILWITDGISALIGVADSGAGSSQASVARAGRASRAGTRAGRIVRLVRLARLVRVVNIAQYFQKEKPSTLDEQEEAERAAAAAARARAEEEGQKRVEASRLGKILSEQTTRRVIIGVLCVMLTLPMLALEVIDATPTFGLKLLFWLAQSSCSTVGNFTMTVDDSDSPLNCADGKTPFASPEVYSHIVYEFTQQSRYYNTDGIRSAALGKPVLYMEAPDPAKNWTITPVETVSTSSCNAMDSKGEPTQYDFRTTPSDGTEGVADLSKCSDAFAAGQCCWQAHNICSPAGQDLGLCPWRDSELEQAFFSPSEICTDGSICESLSFVAIFLIRQDQEYTSLFSIMQTCFIVMLLGVGAMVFSKDTQELVIAPIESMVNIVKSLAEDPLSRPAPEADEEEEFDPNMVPKSKNASSEKLETKTLETTILKIGGLLQVGFGEAGQSIISKNMSSQDGELNILIPGQRLIGIFGFCDIRQFMEVTECLDVEVMVFVNKIARIVHTCTHEWGGSANKNIGDSFLLTWLIHDAAIQYKLSVEGLQSCEQMSELADKALIAFLKTIAELRRASDLAAYSKHPKIIPKFGMEYKVSMGFGLHAGWSIEGAIGSEHKIDASYLSPHVNLCARLETATRQYGVEILFSEVIHGILSTKAKERCRKLDVVKLKGSEMPLGIFTFDINSETLQAPEHHMCGRLIPPADLSAESLASKGTEVYWEVDQDVIHLQESMLSMDFNTRWRQAFSHYISGRWPQAAEGLQRCIALRPQGDGPSQNLLEYVQSYNLECPSDWAGSRKLESK